MRIPNFSNPVKPEELQAAYEAGMIAKKDLKDGTQYAGSCRNAYVAKWDARKQEFNYLRTKFGETFAESIKHPEDDNRFDLFIPMVEIKDPEDEERQTAIAKLKESLKNGK